MKRVQKQQHRTKIKKKKNNEEKTLLYYFNVLQLLLGRKSLNYLNENGLEKNIKAHSETACV